MKRRILFLAFVLSTVVGWSQTVTLKFKNGTIQQYNMSELESVNFTDDNSGGNQETTPSIVGTWDAVSSRYYDDNGENVIEEDTGYWVFTETTVTDHFGEDDLYDGQTLNYTFDGKKLVIGGVFIWDVIKFTSNTMVLKTKIVAGYQESTFRKR
jgi:hypothetical protein